VSVKSAMFKPLVIGQNRMYKRIPKFIFGSRITMCMGSWCTRARKMQRPSFRSRKRLQMQQRHCRRGKRLRCEQQQHMRKLQRRIHAQLCHKGLRRVRCRYVVGWRWKHSVHPMCGRYILRFHSICVLQQLSTWYVPRSRRKIFVQDTPGLRCKQNRDGSECPWCERCIRHCNNRHKLYHRLHKNKSRTRSKMWASHNMHDASTGRRCRLQGNQDPLPLYSIM